MSGSNLCFYRRSACPETRRFASALFRWLTRTRSGVATPPISIGRPGVRGRKSTAAIAHRCAAGRRVGAAFPSGAAIAAFAQRTRGSLVLGALLLMLCQAQALAQPVIPASAQAHLADAQRVFQVKGVVISLKPRQKIIEIKHEAIPNYMLGMTMPFDVKDTNELAGLAPGDTVVFRLTVTATTGWVDQIHKLIAVTDPLPASPPVVVLRDVPQLKVGDALPEYHFTNQFGQAFSTKQFRGQALAITFLFTRCPYPTFCPRMATNFAEVQQKLLTTPDAPTNWHLLTISFDPAFDTPDVLKAYAEAHNCKPKHWTFATGALADITALGDEFGLAFWHDNGSISHNLRTILLDPSGRVRDVFQGNEWGSEDLAKEMEQVARRR